MEVCLNTSKEGAYNISNFKLTMIILITITLNLHYNFTFHVQFYVLIFKDSIDSSRKYPSNYNNYIILQ